MIPPNLLKQILNDEFYGKCVRYKEGTCQGRVTFEHAWVHAGRQIQEAWAIIPLCAYHHEVDEFQDGGDLQKDLNHFLSLQRASDEDLEKYPRTNWKQLRRYLNEKYKTYRE